MSCTTILVGKKATNDGSTMIARTEDFMFEPKKMTVMNPEDQPRKYKCVNGHLEIDLPDEPMRYTACPNADPENGIWAATGINEANVGMTATETITTNPRVQAADPLLRSDDPNIPCGIGEEDMVVLVLPYIRTAREGVLRLGALLEKYGTYEMNGIAFNDKDECWWLETIGGHHWIARRVADREVVIMPNQFGMDRFDMDDAFGGKEENLCSADLREFISDNFLDRGQDGVFNPRNAFGSGSSHDHVYNTPRAWYMGRTLCPTRYRWDGENADFTPFSDNIPWSFVPEKKLAAENVAEMLSSHYENTPYDPCAKYAEKPGIYRPIGINRTGCTGICQIRGYMPKELQAVQWVSFASTAYSAFVPLYTNVSKVPEYMSEVTTDASTENLSWASRLIGALADHSYGHSILTVERYKAAVAAGGRRIILEYDRKMKESGKFDLFEEANEKIVSIAKEETTKCLNEVLLNACREMKNGYSRWDN
ncbi:MAG: C69 family dipeptidase [Eubacteriaceae bacterium]|nr:C69 family dipeptidase [Eubacteriaceae bacterium]